MPNRSLLRHRLRADFGLRISKAGGLYIAITLLLGFSAVNTGNNLLFLVVSGLLAFMSVTGLAGMLNLKKLTPQLLPPTEIFAGTCAPFQLKIHNGKRSMPSYLIRVDCSGGQGITLPVVSPGSFGEGVVELTFSRRGRVTVGKIKLSSSFPVNFFNRTWTFFQELDLIVFPRLLSGMAGGEGDRRQRPGSFLRRSRGHEGELERIAGYTGREPLRMIHWKLSARGDDLVVKEFGGQSALPLVIDPETLPGQNREERISRAAWLVKRWSPVRPVGLRLNGRTIPAGGGHRHCLQLLTELALHDAT